MWRARRASEVMVYTGKASRHGLCDTTRIALLLDFKPNINSSNLLITVPTTPQSADDSGMD